MEATTLRFADAARTLTVTARSLGLEVPAFRSPPGLRDVQRSLRRRAGSVTVAVRLRERPWPAVVADMIDGVLAANRLRGSDADRVRAQLWAALEGHDSIAA